MRARPPHAHAMETPHIQVRVDSESLRHALEGFLRHVVEGGAVLDDGHPSVPRPADVVITTDSSCPPEECRSLARQARAVIVLAAVPRASAQALYFHAGAAAYLPMDATGESLIEVLNGILSKSSGD